MDVNSKVSDRNVIAGHDSARTIMNKCGADALIWGRVRKLEGRNRVPKLYLTVSPNDALNKVGSYNPTEDPKPQWHGYDELVSAFGVL
jgi:hypothetical protein